MGYVSKSGQGLLHPGTSLFSIWYAHTLGTSEHLVTKLETACDMAFSHALFLQSGDLGPISWLVRPITDTSVTGEKEME